MSHEALRTLVAAGELSATLAAHLTLLADAGVPIVVAGGAAADRRDALARNVADGFARRIPLAVRVQLGDADAAHAHFPAAARELTCAASSQQEDEERQEDRDEGRTPREGGRHPRRQVVWKTLDHAHDGDDREGKQREDRDRDRHAD